MAFLSDALPGIIVGGIIGFVSTFVINRIEAHIKRPILSISEQITFWGMAEGETLWTAARIEYIQAIQLRK